MKKTRVVKESQSRYTMPTRRKVEKRPNRIVLRNTTSAQTKLVRRDSTLYEKFAKHLEHEHKGEFVAIGLDGALLVGASHAQVLNQAAEKFGAGNFALRKIGYDYVLKWRRL